MYTMSYQDSTPEDDTSVIHIWLSLDRATRAFIRAHIKRETGWRRRGVDQFNQPTNDDSAAVDWYFYHTAQPQATVTWDPPMNLLDAELRIALMYSSMSYSDQQTALAPRPPAATRVPQPPPAALADPAATPRPPLAAPSPVRSPLLPAPAPAALWTAPSPPAPPVIAIPSVAHARPRPTLRRDPRDGRPVFVQRNPLQLALALAIDLQASSLAQAQPDPDTVASSVPMSRHEAAALRKEMRAALAPGWKSAGPSATPSQLLAAIQRSEREKPPTPAAAPASSPSPPPPAAAAGPAKAPPKHGAAGQLPAMYEQNARVARASSFHPRQAIASFLDSLPTWKPGRAAAPEPAAPHIPPPESAAEPLSPPPSKPASPPPVSPAHSPVRLACSSVSSSSSASSPSVDVDGAEFAMYDATYQGRKPADTLAPPASTSPGSTPRTCLQSISAFCSRIFSCCKRTPEESAQPSNPDDVAAPPVTVSFEPQQQQQAQAQQPERLSPGPRQASQTGLFTPGRGPLPPRRMLPPQHMSSSPRQLPLRRARPLTLPRPAAPRMASPRPHVQPWPGPSPRGPAPASKPPSKWQALKAKWRERRAAPAASSRGQLDARPSLSAGRGPPSAGSPIQAVSGLPRFGAQARSPRPAAARPWNSTYQAGPTPPSNLHAPLGPPPWVTMQSQPAHDEPEDTYTSSENQSPGHPQAQHRAPSAPGSPPSPETQARQAYLRDVRQSVTAALDGMTQAAQIAQATAAAQARAEAILAGLKSPPSTHS